MGNKLNDKNIDLFDDVGPDLEPLDPFQKNQQTKNDAKMSGIFKYVRNATDIEAKEPEFLWYPYFPAGQVIMLAAPSGTGKTYGIIAITASFSVGKIPISEEPVTPARTLYITNEDDDELIKLRFINSGGDEKMLDVISIKAIDDADEHNEPELNLSDRTQLLSLEQYVKENNIKIIVIDPLTSFCGDANLEKAADASRVLSGLRRVAKHCNAYIVGIFHNTKIQKVNKLEDLIEGSGKLVAKARSVMMVFKDDPINDPDRRIVVLIKSNYSAEADKKTLTFEIKDRGAHFTGYSSVTREALDEYYGNGTQGLTIAQFMAQRYTPLSGEKTKAELISNVIRNLAVSQGAERKFYTYSYMKDHFKDFFSATTKVKVEIENAMRRFPLGDYYLDFPNYPVSPAIGEKQERGFYIIRLTERG